MATAPRLSEALEPIDDDIVLDFAGVTFMDSSAIGVLVNTHKRLQANGHRIRLEYLQDAPRRALETLGVLTHLT